jgi:hypothetical protein
MKLLAKLSLTLALALSMEASAWPQEVVRGQVQVRVVKRASVRSSTPAAPVSSTMGNYRGTTRRYATEFDGDHSLEAATVAEQVFAQYSLYTVRLQFASGAEQSIAVTAPPGGLQPEMRDMSGDSVPNDVVLTSKLFHWPLVVLLNDGHDHLTVAISPESLASGEDQASGPHQAPRASPLVSSGFKTGGLTNGGGLFLPRLQEDLFSPIVQIVVMLADYTSSSGRAPPALVTNS